MKKKIMCFIAFILTFTCILISCDKQEPSTTENPTHTHSYGEWIPLQAATCTTNGTRAKYCSCGDKITETISSTGHFYGNWLVTEAATCTSSGTKTKQCSCGKKITETIPSTGHDWVDATCTEDEHCSKCNKRYSGTATGHIIQHGACVFCNMPGASIEWGYHDWKMVEYYFLYSNGDISIKGVGYIGPDYGSNGAAFYRDGYLYFRVDGKRDGTLMFNYEIVDSYGRVAQSGYISVGYVQSGQTYMIRKFIGSLNPGEYTLTVSSHNGME